MLPKTSNPYRGVLFLIFVVVVLSWFSFTYAQEGDSSHPRMYWLERITQDGKLLVQEYNASAQTVDTPNLEIWSEKLNTHDPLSSLYWDEKPDFERLLLEQGFAHLKDESTASPDHVLAQNRAKLEGRGLWASSSPLATSPLQVIKGILTAFIGFAGLFGGYELIKLILDWLKRRHVPLIMLGRPSTGKSWLWHRLVDPETGLDELKAVKRTELPVVYKPVHTKPMGRYEITPVFIDTPGGKAGEQVNNLLIERNWRQRLRRFLLRQKTIWIIMLATTPDGNTQGKDAWERKVDSPYIEQQLGYLDLPTGLLASRKTLKPQMVIACIGKFDLFADHSPQDSSSQEIRDRLEELFQRHLSRIQDECKNQNVPFKLVLCSALKSWGTDDILRHIEKALFQ
jgi:hypothetical protein